MERRDRPRSFEPTRQLQRRVDSPILHPSQLLQLQRSIGNHAITSLFTNQLSSATIQRQDDETQVLPLFTQSKAVECGAASLISAVMVWDNEHAAEGRSEGYPALGRVIEHLRRSAATVPLRAPITRDIRTAMVVHLDGMADAARQPQHQFTEGQYGALAAVAYLIYNTNGEAALNPQELAELRQGVGLAGEQTTSISFQAFYELAATPVVVGMRRGETAQVEWVAGSERVSGHAFIVGRLRSGSWYLLDQSGVPGGAGAYRVVRDDPGALIRQVPVDRRNGRTQIYTGSLSDLRPTVIMSGPPSTGLITPLGRPPPPPRADFAIDDLTRQQLRALGMPQPD